MDAPLYRHRCEIAFADTDASGAMHFPNVFRFVEAAEHAFLKSRNVLTFNRQDGSWPRLQVWCDYKKPLVCGEFIEVLLTISRLGGSSLTWEFEVLTASGELAAHGGMTTARVDHLGAAQQISPEERAALSAPAAQ